MVPNRVAPSDDRPRLAFDSAHKNHRVLAGNHRVDIAAVVSNGRFSGNSLNKHPDAHDGVHDDELNENAVNAAMRHE